jgi:hypothetical protein
MEVLGDEGGREMIEFFLYGGVVVIAMVKSVSGSSRGGEMDQTVLLQSRASKQERS